MNNEVKYKSNPLNGVSLKTVLTEIVDHYGFEILFAYLNINCFKTNPSVDSSIKFLKKTEWAREKVEVFYLYEFKNLPRASSEQFQLPPRDRVIPEHQIPGEPAVLSMEDAERLREKRAKKAAERDAERGGSSYSRSSNRSTKKEYGAPSSRSVSIGRDVDPWAKLRGKSED